LDAQSLITGIWNPGRQGRPHAQHGSHGPAHKANSHQGTRLEQSRSHDRIGLQRSDAGGLLLWGREAQKNGGWSRNRTMPWLRAPTPRPLSVRKVFRMPVLSHINGTLPSQVTSIDWQIPDV